MQAEVEGSLNKPMEGPSRRTLLWNASKTAPPVYRTPDIMNYYLVLIPFRVRNMGISLYSFRSISNRINWYCLAYNTSHLNSQHLFIVHSAHTKLEASMYSRLSAQHRL